MQTFKEEKIAVLTAIIKNQQKIFAKSDDEIYARKPSPAQWSKKEIVGHLIDSAMNNIQRFIRAQYETKPSISYDQDVWVNLNGYQQTSLESLTDLWILLNERILVIIGRMSDEIFDKTCLAGGKEYSVAWLIDDYIRHLQHHLNQINANSPGV